MVGFVGLKYAPCLCPWWRRLLGLHQAHVHMPIVSSRYAPVVSSRYAPGSVIAPEQPIDYAELERAYEAASRSSEEPSLGISTIGSMAMVRSSQTGETVEDARQWLIDHSELVKIEGIGTAYRIKSDVGTAWMYP